MATGFAPIKIAIKKLRFFGRPIINLIVPMLLVSTLIPLEHCSGVPWEFPRNLLQVRRSLRPPFPASFWAHVWDSDRLPGPWPDLVALCSVPADEGGSRRCRCPSGSLRLQLPMLLQGVWQTETELIFCGWLPIADSSAPSSRSAARLIVSCPHRGKLVPHRSHPAAEANICSFPVFAACSHPKPSYISYLTHRLVVGYRNPLFQIWSKETRFFSVWGYAKFLTCILPNDFHHLCILLQMSQIQFPGSVAFHVQRACAWSAGPAVRAAEETGERILSSLGS